MKTLIVEGWRFIAHSYAVVNQYQCLEILKHPDIKLYHRDVQMFLRTWKQSEGTMPADQEAALRAIPEPPKGLVADSCLRIGFPHYFHASADAKRTFTWATSEFLRVQDEAIGIKKKPWEALVNSKSTIIVCSNWAAKGFLNSGASKSKVVVVPCGVDPSIFHPVSAEERAALRKELGWEGKFVALNISAATPNKGLDIAMRAVAQLAPSHPNLHLALKGSNHLYRSDYFVKSAMAAITPEEAEAVTPRLTYQGETLSTTDIAKLYQAADVYLSPYRAEGFNIPVLESAACGLPVIATRGGSTDDFTDPSWCQGVDAEVKEYQDKLMMLDPPAADVAAVLDRVIRDEAWRQSASEAGPPWARNSYTWKHSVDKLLKVILPG